MVMTLFDYLLAQLEDGQRDGDDEREEGQLQRVEGLQTEHAERQWNQGDGLQQDEHHDWDDDLLQLGFASWSREKPNMFLLI